jgi:Lon protease-like protein
MGVAQRKEQSCVLCPVVLHGMPSSACLAVLGGAAQPEEGQKPVSIPFADIGAIRDFRPVGDEALLIEAAGHRCFRATFFGRCIGLRSAENVAFMTEPGGSLDRFSAIYVDGHRCAFRTFEPTEPPAKKESAAQAKP